MRRTSPSLAKERYRSARRLAAHRLFRRMIARQQIDLATIHCVAAEHSLYRALHTCAHCPAKAACAAWLASNQPAKSYVRFCPNAEMIETLRILAA
jgi:hypothetical protein